MKLQSLKLINFRNYSNLEIEFSSELNIIYGNNGSGKSNLVEAIYLLALTKSFRTNNDLNMIKDKSKSLDVIGKIVTEEKTKYEVVLSEEGKKVYIDSDKVAKISDYISRINIIVFNPLDNKIISDSPSVRRKMLDIEISGINKEYLILLSSYNKVLKNRNAYLKTAYINANASTDYLDILTRKLISFGRRISEIRKEYIDKINNNITKVYEQIFESGTLKVRYKSAFKDKDEDTIYEMIKKNYSKEIELGKTYLGIHHDDLEFILDGHIIKDYGSVGQQKNAIISFKLSEIPIVKEEKGLYPILILDDLFSELDDIKINNIIQMLNKNVQTFITTTSIDKVDKKLIEQSTIYKVENNKVERIEE